MASERGVRPFVKVLRNSVVLVTVRWNGMDARLQGKYCSYNLLCLSIAPF